MPIFMPETQMARKVISNRLTPPPTLKIYHASKQKFQFLLLSKITIKNKSPASKYKCFIKK
jgi:hypothetical protein